MSQHEEFAPDAVPRYSIRDYTGQPAGVAFTLADARGSADSLGGWATEMRTGEIVHGHDRAAEIGAREAIAPARAGYSPIEADLSSADRLERVLDLLGHSNGTPRVHSSNLLHALEAFAISAGDVSLEEATRDRIERLREAIAANRT